MPVDHMTDAGLRLAHRGILSAADAVGLVMNRSEKRQLSLVDILQGLKDYQRVTGFAAEALAERARVMGQDFDPQRPTIPWSTLQVETRAPLAANLGAADGGYLVPTNTESSVIDVLRPNSLAVQCGATVYDGLAHAHSAVFPKLATDLAGEWLTSETTAIVEQQPTFTASQVTPHDYGAMFRWTRQLAIQAPNMEPFLRTIAARAAGQAVDTAALIGTGSNGQPLGLLNQPGIGAQSGGAYSHINSLTTRGALAALNVPDDNIAWLGSPDVRTILAARERAAGDQFIWDRDLVTNRAARVTSILPAQTLICGDFASLAICLFGDGFQVDTSAGFHSAADFAAGISAMRVLVSLDIFLQHAASFVVVSSVT